MGGSHESTTHESAIYKAISQGTSKDSELHHAHQPQHKRDQIYACPLNQVDAFSFDKNVADVFPDMIKRSVPGYATIISMIGHLAERYSQADSYCYDLGCSLGAATLAMRHRIHAAGCRIIAVDNSPAMVDRCRQVITADSGEVPVDLVCANLQDIVIEQASIVVLNFTLQFIPPAQRAYILDTIYRGLKPGGVFILSEKVAFEELPHQQLMTELHHNFKRTNGYSDLEIAQKRTALENVLIPDTLEGHRERLKQTGFNSADVWFQCFNFASLIAIK
jgi:tRNA (cmo5U34)-methyltransferase